MAAEGWQKQKRKDWNLRALEGPEGTGCDGRGERDRGMDEAEGTGRWQRRKGRNWMAEAEGTGWQRRKGPPDGAAKRKKRERAKRKEQGMQRKEGPDGRSRSGRTGT